MSRAKQDVETMEFLAAAERFMRAAGRRCADADEIEFARLIAFQQVYDDAVATAVHGLKARGMSWAWIATQLGITREGAYWRYGRKTS